jgi:hypothetical protein
VNGAPGGELHFCVWIEKVMALWTLMRTDLASPGHWRWLFLAAAVPVTIFSLRSYAVLNLLAAFLLFVLLFAVLSFIAAAFLIFVDGFDSLIRRGLAHFGISSFWPSQGGSWRIT